MIDDISYSAKKTKYHRFENSTQDNMVYRYRYQFIIWSYLTRVNVRQFRFDVKLNKYFSGWLKPFIGDGYTFFHSNLYKLYSNDVMSILNWLHRLLNWLRLFLKFGLSNVFHMDFIFVMFLNKRSQIAEKLWNQIKIVLIEIGDMNTSKTNVVPNNVSVRCQAKNGHRNNLEWMIISML